MKNTVKEDIKDFFEDVFTKLFVTICLVVVDLLIAAALDAFLTGAMCLIFDWPFKEGFVFLSPLALIVVGIYFILQMIALWFRS